MKLRFILPFLYVILCWLPGFSQDKLAVEPLFSGRYNKNDKAVVVLIKGKKLEPYGLSLFHSITVKDSPEDIARFCRFTMEDSGRAVNSQLIKSEDDIVAAYFQYSPVRPGHKDPNRFVLFRRIAPDEATLIYLEGATDLDSLIRIFINKK